MTVLGELKHGIWREAYKYYKETVLVFQEKDPLTFNNRPTVLESKCRNHN